MPVDGFVWVKCRAPLRIEEVKCNVPRSGSFCACTTLEAQHPKHGEL